MPPKEIAKRRLSKVHQKRQEEIRNESSEDRQFANITETTAEEFKKEQQIRLESNRLIKLETKQRQTAEQRERKRQRMLESQERYKSTETQELQHERRLEYQRVRVRRIREMETPEKRQRRLESDRLRKLQARQCETPKQRERRLERMRAWHKRVKETETPEQRRAKLEKGRKYYEWKKSIKKNNEGVVPVESTIVIKEEPVDFLPEPFISKDKHIKNIKKDNEDAVRVQPVVIKEESMEFDPEPSTSADIVIKDEFVVSNEDYTGSSTDVPLCTAPTSHVTFSVAFLGSSQKPDNGQ